MTVGGRIALLRRRRGQSQAALAHELGVHPVTVWRWEANLKLPHLDALVHLAQVAQVPVSWFIPEDDGYIESEDWLERRSRLL